MIASEFLSVRWKSACRAGTFAVRRTAALINTLVDFMRIPDDWQGNSIFLYPSEHDAHEGTRAGGSGFLLGFDSDRLQGLQTVYAVTNAHVIESGSCALRLNRHDGTVEVRDLDDRDWIMPASHDDIAICRLSALDQAVHKYKCVSNRRLATREVVSQFGIGPGDETITIGRFINADGVQRNTPTVRFGNIAQMPGEPILQDRRIVGTTQNFKQVSYLVEAKSVSGFSGSSVFVHFSPFSQRPDGKPHTWDTYLLGVSWGYIMGWEYLRDDFGRLLESRTKVRVNTGMMGVVPAWILHDLLMRPDLVQQRTQAEDRYIALTGQKPSVDSSSLG